MKTKPNRRPPRPLSPQAGRRLLLWVIYAGPPLLWMLVVFAASTRLGSYEATWTLNRRVFAFLAPHWGVIDDSSLYQINDALRRLSYVGAYAVLTLLAVRAIQFGQPELKRASALAALGISIVFAAGDALHRRFVPGRHGDIADVWLSVLGACATMAVILLWFRLKRWERDLAQAARPPEDAIH